MELTSIYLHIPFCRQRCAYCDFNTYAGKEGIIPQYVDAVCREVSWISRSLDVSVPVHTIYFGGGTPSLLSPDQIGQILQAIKAGLDVQPGVEISIEANPGTLSGEYLQGLRGMGINRLSIGMQSAHEAELRLLGRIHSFEDVINSVTWARAAGFDNINLDLIYGLPGQPLEDWRRSLELALRLHPEHFSLYALTLEEDVLLARWIRRGLVVEQDADMAAEMYELAERLLETAGYESYEISNWAQYDGVGNLRGCKHNMQYWRGKPYLGLGAGAHGYSNHMRTVNALNPEEYINRIRQEFIPNNYSFPMTPANIEYNILSSSDEMGEYMMMGLRLTQEGVKEIDFSERFGQSLEIAYRWQIDRLIKNELLEWVEGPQRRLRLTKRGRLLGNQVFREFM